MHWESRTVFVVLLTLLIMHLSMSNTIYVSPTGNSDQSIINNAIQQAVSSGGGTVYLGTGTYVITGPIHIQSNVVLTGDKNAILQVPSSSNQWFTGSNSIICVTGPVNNIEISNFQIDGNCELLPFEYHHSSVPNSAHDCERAIYIAGSTNKYCNNIKIHDLQLYDCFSDGIHVRFANNVHCYSNFISNCQHEGIFWVCVQNGLMESNKIAGITSDCARIDNGVNCVVKNNYFFSYTGNHNSKAPENGINGIQIADEGSSHGYNGANKPTHTTNIEVTNNTFVNTGTTAVLLDSTGKGYINVPVQGNTFVGVKAFTNAGTSVSLNITTESNTSLPNYTGNTSELGTNLTTTIQPSTEMSKQVFNSVFEFLHLNTCVQVQDNETVILPTGVPKTPSNVTGEIEYMRIDGDDYTLVGVPTEGLSEVQYTIMGQTETHTRMLGETTSAGIQFTETSLWKGNLSTNGNYVQLSGRIPSDQIKIKCLSPTKTITPHITIKDSEGQVIRIEPGVIVIIILLYLLYKMLIFFIRDWLS